MPPQKRREASRQKLRRIDRDFGRASMPNPHLSERFEISRLNQRAARAISRRRFLSLYLATRSFESLVAIWLNTVTIWLACVSMNVLLESLAQLCSMVEVGSVPPVLTWIV